MCCFFLTCRRGKVIFSIFSFFPSFSGYNINFDFFNKSVLSAFAMSIRSVMRIISLEHILTVPLYVSSTARVQLGRGKVRQRSSCIRQLLRGRP